MVTKNDWKTVEMPAEKDYFSVQIKLTNEEMKMLKQGHIPLQMEDKWFMYFDSNKIYMHRSWTGYCIYIGEFTENDTINVTVNRNKEQYTNTNIELDKTDFEIHINALTGRSNRELMLKYMRIRKENT